MIEVAVRGWRHHDIMSRHRGGESARHASPGHDGCARSEAALENLIPADRPAAFAGQKLLHSPHEAGLEFGFVLQTFGADAGLAFRALPPAIFRDFVAANVNEAAGERLDDFGEDFLHESKGTF